MGALKLEFLYFPLFYKIMPPSHSLLPPCRPPATSHETSVRATHALAWGPPGQTRDQKAGRKGEGEAGGSGNLQLETEWKKGERQSGEAMEKGRNKRVETESPPEERCP